MLKQKLSQHFGFILIAICTNSDVESSGKFISSISQLAYISRPNIEVQCCACVSVAQDTLHAFNVRSLS